MCRFNWTCGCNQPSTWMKVASLDISRYPNQVCPGDWSTIIYSTTNTRACSNGRGRTRGCSSAFFSTFGMKYSRVCGSVQAYQDGYPDAFHSFSQIDEAYLDGVSITHGSVGSRQHIWSFANAAGEGYRNDSVCAYSTRGYSPPTVIPSFVGNDYFCNTGNNLWTEYGCGLNSNCCQFNNPPNFCKTLPQSTTDDLEVRICKDELDEDTPIWKLELHIQ